VLDESEHYRERMRRESWSIVVPEVRYEVGPT
jgi:hypothetical protein